MALIQLENVGVHFMVPQMKRKNFGQAEKSFKLGGAMQAKHGKMGVSALHDINFTLRSGDRLGLIGNNGAGKTTLLRVLAGILPPTEGRIRIEGRVSALMSIRLGMDSAATGYDNIISRALYMGCSEREIKERFEEIAEFTELGDYLSLPIDTYSSGMRVRLAFAIATAFVPDILILDEWLSAGDERFKNKASERLNGLIQGTGVVAFASHNLGMLKKVCTKGAVLEEGRLLYFGPIEDAVLFADLSPGERSMIASDA